ncbi:unnamed protein product [Sphacelaria rigidula]
MAEVSPLFRRGVFEEDSVPSGGVAVRDCVAVPVSPLVSSVKLTEAQVFSTAQVSVEADDLSHWFGGASVPFRGVLSYTMGVPGVARLKVQGGSVREERLIYAVHWVMVRVLLFLRSGLEDYKEGITRGVCCCGERRVGY